MLKLAYYSRIVLVLPVFMLFSGKAGADSLTYFSGGKQKELASDRIAAILKVTDKMMQGTDNAFRLIVTEQYVNELRDKRKGIEITLEKEHKVATNNPELTYKFTRLLIPFCRDLSCSNKGAQFLIGNKKMYFTPPYINTQGGIYIEKIKQLIAK